MDEWYRRPTVLDAMEFIHRVTTQIPDPRRHLIRYYGAYSHRHRGARRAREEAAAGVPQAASASDGDAVTPASPSRASWARLVRRIYEVDPLLCPRCSGPLSLVAVITDQKVVTAILRHLETHGQPTSVHVHAHERVEDSVENGGSQVKLAATNAIVSAAW